MTTWDEQAETIAGAMRAILNGYDGSVEEFYASGEKHVKDLLLSLEFAEKHPVAQDCSVLEYGCGIGRMTAHLAPLFGRVVALDFSPKMIVWAKKNVVRDNAIFVASRGLMAPVVWLNAKYRYIFSHIVFQHMPYEEVWKIFDQAHDILEVGGVLHTQMDYGSADHEIRGDDQFTCRPWDIPVLRSYLEGWTSKKWQVLNPLAEVVGTTEPWRWLTMKKT